jgi:hypothetical protein
MLEELVEHVGSTSGACWKRPAVHVTRAAPRACHESCSKSMFAACCSLHPHAIKTCVWRVWCVCGEYGGCVASMANGEYSGYDEYEA